MFKLMSIMFSNMTSGYWLGLLIIFFLWLIPISFTLISFAYRKRLYPFRSILDSIESPYKYKFIERILSLMGTFLSLLYDVLIYNLIRLLVMPQSTEFGAFLIGALILRRSIAIANILIYPTLLKNTHKNKASKKSSGLACGYIILERLSGTIGIAGIVLALSLVLIGTSHLSDRLLIRSDFENSLNKAHEDLSTLVSDAAIIQQSLDKVLKDEKEARQNASSSKETLLQIESSIESLRKEKLSLESDIVALRQKSEKQIKSEVVYQTISSLISSGWLKNLLLGFIVGVVASLVANFISTRGSIKKHSLLSQYEAPNKIKDGSITNHSNQNTKT